MNWTSLTNRRFLSYTGLGVAVAGLLAFTLWPSQPAAPPRAAATPKLAAARLTSTPRRPSATPARYKPLFDSILKAVPPTATQTRQPTIKAQKKPTPAATPRPKPAATPPFVLHTVKKGETLIAIAAFYDVNSETLLVVNRMRNPNDLQVGQKLVIPPADGLSVPVVLHKIQPADTLLNIAAKYGSSVNNILAVNSNLRPPELPVGQMLAVPVVFDEARPTPEPVEDANAEYHTVEPGDMPLSIAYEHDVPVELLLAVNEITDPTLLQIGQKLVIPPADDLTMGVPIILYQLEEGDTLLGIATRFGSSVKDILAVNPDLDIASLQVGQTVAIPVIFAPIRPTPQPGAPARPVRPPVEPSAPLVDLQQQMIALVNAQRQAAGLAPYTVDEQMTQLAVAHARDMVSRDFFSHSTPEGLTLRDRFTKQGIQTGYHVGEDIQRNTLPRAQTVETAFNWFMGSRPHRQNLLHKIHHRIGVGIVEGPAGWYTFVLVFAE